MKKVVVILAVFLVATLMVGCQPVAPSPDIETYTETEYGFSVDYPRGWEAEEEYWLGGASIGFFKRGVVGVSIIIFAPPEEATMGPEFYSLEHFYDSGVYSWSDHEGFEVLEELDTTVGNLPAKQMTHTYTIKSDPSIWKHTVTYLLDTLHTAPPDSNAFKIVYGMPTECPEDWLIPYYDDHYQDYELIVSTFRLLDD